MRHKGSLEVICGSMFSGKTEELMRRLKRAEYAKQKTITIKHHIDDRKSFSCIVSHDGNQRDAYPLGDTASSVEGLLTLAKDEVHVVGVDEVQFFPEQMIDVIERLIDNGKRVIVAGLDMDFRGEPFSIVPTLMAMADEVTKLRAICMKCGRDANFTQRLINGQPANYEDPTILVGARECYECRCRDCHVMEKAAVTA